MKKKILLATILAVLASVPVFAAAAEQEQNQNNWYNQMMQNHQQMVQRAVENGTINQEQAAQINEHMQQMAPVMQQMMKNGPMMGNGYGPGSCFANVNNVNNTN